MKILIVDDEKLIRDVIREYATLEGYDTLEAEDGLDAIEKVKDNDDIDLLILDIMMPKMDGLSAYKKIKEIRNIPTIILSARSEEYDKITSFDLGIDDYVTKPFSPFELMMRVKAIIRRCNKEKLEFVYKGLRIDFLGHAVFIDDKEINLTPKEYDILVYLANNPNIAISRDVLLNKVWGYDYYGDNRTVDTHIKMLRNNLLEYRSLIKTIHSVGYKFEIKE